jgi:tetratricopeptide (TPR) repeat protein
VTIRNLIGGLVVLSLLAACAGPARTGSKQGIPTPWDLDLARMLCPSLDSQATEYFGQASAHEAAGRLEQAKELYLKAIELDPGFCDAMDNVGRIFRVLGEFDEAILYYKRSLEVLPTNQVALMNQGVAYLSAGRHHDATDTYQQLTQLAPENPEGHYGLGLVYTELGQWESAVSNYLAAEELYVERDSALVSDVRISVANCYLVMGDAVQARDYLELVWDSEPDNAFANYLLGRCYLFPALSDIEKATEYLKRAEELGFPVAQELFGTE